MYQGDCFSTRSWLILDNTAEFKQYKERLDYSSPLIKYFLSFELDDIDLLINRFAKYNQNFLDDDDLS